jgi:DNA-binding beta-propeller fold protein YncE
MNRAFSPLLVFAGTTMAHAQDSRPATTTAPTVFQLGTGANTFTWAGGWGRLPAGMSYGNTHGGIVTDRKGNVYMNTDSEHAVIVWTPAGEFVKSWGKEFKGGLHGMAIVTEGDQEFLLMAHTARHEVVKTTLDGQVLWAKGFPETAGIYQKAAQYLPTAVAVAPDGRFFVADGYGQSWVHLYDQKGDYVRSFGGRGKEPGQMQTPHGLWIDTRGKAPVLLVADRENHRIQRFDLEGKLIDVLTPDLRRPCGMHQWQDLLVVADLAGRITLLDKDNQLIAHLGENQDQKKWANNGVPREQWVDGQFIAPHAARFDADGNIYVLDWVAQGRFSKLLRR